MGTCPSLHMDLLYEDVSNVWSCGSYAMTMRQSAIHMPKIAEKTNKNHLGVGAHGYPTEFTLES